jgi:hypothetical protein
MGVVSGYFMKNQLGGVSSKVLRSRSFVSKSRLFLEILPVLLEAFSQEFAEISVEGDWSVAGLLF